MTLQNPDQLIIKRQWEIDELRKLAAQRVQLIRHWPTWTGWWVAFGLAVYILVMHSNFDTTTKRIAALEQSQASWPSQFSNLTADLQQSAREIKQVAIQQVKTHLGRSVTRLTQSDAALQQITDALWAIQTPEVEREMQLLNRIRALEYSRP